MAVRKIKLTIQYDGFSYHGWQFQRGLKTIQAAINEAMEGLFGFAVTIRGASRTDAGVSALGQEAVIRVDTPVPTRNIAKALTARLPKDIAVTEAVDVDPEFDLASALCKQYRYTICADPLRPVMDIKHCWHYPYKLDANAMDKAAKLIIGKKDFKSFASAADKRQDTVRTIFRCSVTEKDLWIFIEIEGNAFLYNMVRNIVGTLIEVGRKRWQPEEITEIIDKKSRTAAGPIAPAGGLTLMWIRY